MRVLGVLGGAWVVHGSAGCRVVGAGECWVVVQVSAGAWVVHGWCMRVIWECWVQVMVLGVLGGDGWCMGGAWECWVVHGSAGWCSWWCSW